MSHTGSWGTPDFGITERISDLLGFTRYSSGGSDLVMDQYQNPATADLNKTGTYQMNPTQQQSYLNTYASTPQVLGKNTSNPPANPAPTNTGAFPSDQYKGWDPVAAQADWEAKQREGSSGPSYEDIMRQQIEGGYSNYFGELDNMLNTSLPGQKTAQEGIANTSYNTNVTDLGLQKDQNQADLDIQAGKTQTNQVKTLKDISSNIRNLMNAGNTYLGSMGAGDSSAVNQYAYGLTKLGSQQRGDVQAQTASILSDIADRGSKLNNIYMQEKNRLAGERDTRIGQIADWFASAQQQLQTAKAQGQLSKSQDLQSLTTNLYQAAITKLTAIQNQTAQRQASLESWAMSNATNLAQLKQNMAGIGAYTAPQQQYGQITGTPQFAPAGTSTAKFGGTNASVEDELKRLAGL